MDSKNKRNLKSSKLRKIILLLVFLMLIIWLIWENTALQISHVSIFDHHIPEAFNGFKIAHLSDIHNKNWGQTLIQPIKEEDPDIIVITGDLIDARTPDIHVVSELVDELKEIAPIYFVTGNHEASSELYPLLEEELLAHEVILLDNDAAYLQKNEAEILLLGVQDPAFTLGDYLSNTLDSVVDAEIKALKQYSNGYKILLSHRPEVFDVYVRNDMNLVLAGHAHGGQVRLPFIGGLIAPDQGYFPEFTSGVYEEGETKMVVSRGLGNSIIPVRINNRFELIFIELEN